MGSRKWISNIESWDGMGVLSVLGPTGSGKTSTVLSEVGKRFPLKFPSLVSVDAVAAYRGLDIGSAKPQGLELAEHSWCGLDIVDASESISVARYLLSVSPQVEDALQAQRPVVLVGGSHFYERALVEGSAPGLASDPEFLSSLGPSELLHRSLCLQDPRWEQKVHLNDRYRLERYSDLVIRQGLSFDDLFSAPKSGLLLKLDITCLALGLDIDFDSNRVRLQERIAKMIEAGWIDEVQALLAKGYKPSDPGLQNVGYLEICEHLSGKLSRPDMLEQILTKHQQLSKKQRTWIRGLQLKSS